MKPSKKIVSIVILLLVILTSFFGYTHASEASHPAIGPSYIGLNNVLKGTEVQRTIFIDNTDEYDHVVNLSFIGEIKSWVTFHNMGNTTVPITTKIVNKSSYIPLVFKITVPEDAANRAYYGNISAKFESIDVNETGAHVVLEQQAVVRIDVVGDQILNVSVNRISIGDVEADFNAKVTVDFENTGNVLAKPIVEVTFNRVDGVNIGSLSSEDDEYSFDEIKPGELGSYFMWWNTSEAQLAQFGKYEAHFTITLDGTIIKEETIIFEVFEKESLLRKGELEELRYEGILKKGENVHIFSNFTNTGEIDINAQFFAKIYLNGDLLYDEEQTKSPIVNVPKNDKAAFESIIPIEKDGEYRIECYVHYNDVLNVINGNTDPLQLKFTVGAVSILDFNPLYLVPILIVVILVILFLVRRKGAFKPVKTKTLDKKKIKPKKVVKEKKVKVKPVKEPKRRIKFGRNLEKSPFRSKQETAPKEKSKKVKKKKFKDDSISKKVDEIIKNKPKKK